MRTLLLCLLITAAAAAEPRLRPETWARPVISEKLANWFKLDDKLFRSAQPDRDGMLDAKKLGITTVLNLRDNHDDDEEAKGTGLKLVRIEMEADEVTIEQVIQALKAIRAAEGPVLVHCWHGSDRTGTVCAFYRIVVQGWTKAAALDEMVNGGYGYHAMFDNLPKLIDGADLDRIRREVLGPAVPATPAAPVAPRAD